MSRKDRVPETDQEDFSDIYNDGVSLEKEEVAEFIDRFEEPDEPEEKEKEVDTSTLESILYKVPYVEDPLIGTPKQVQSELDSIAIIIQKDPYAEGSDLLYNKIHLYMHGYLINVALKQFPYIKGYQTSDVYQESLIALRFKAIPNFQDDRGMSFLNFAKMCIRRHLITLLNASNKRKRDQSINQAISIDVPTTEGDDSSTLSNTLSDKSLSFEKVSEKKEAFEFTKDILMSSLSDFEREVLFEYLLNSSYREIARSISNKTSKRCAPKAVDNALLRIRKKAMSLKGSKSNDDLPMFI